MPNARGEWPIIRIDGAMSTHLPGALIARTGIVVDALRRHRFGLHAERSGDCRHRKAQEQNPQQPLSELHHARHFPLGIYDLL